MTPIRQAVRSARAKIIGGEELSGILDDTRQFTPDVICGHRLGRRDRQAARRASPIWPTTTTSKSR